VNRIFALTILAFLVLGRGAFADDADAPAFKLELKPQPGLPNGKVATIQGTGGLPGDKFFIESVGVLQPVVITLIAKKKGDVLHLVTGKQRWDETIDKADTGADGQVTIKLRTQGEVRMTVSADGDPKPYYLVVWAGDEVKPDFAPVFTPMNAAAAGGSSTGSIVIAGIIGLLIVILVVWLKKRGAK